MDSIILSPHLDDAVFACGGMIAGAAAAGQQVRVLTFYTGQPEPSQVKRRLAKFCRYDERKAEDERATAALGARCEWRDLVERAFRPPAVSGLAAVFHTPATTAGFVNLESLTAEIDGLLRAQPGARLLAPLGVGNHFDHVEVSLAAMRVLLQRDAADRFAFYEDSYALGTRARRLHPVTRQRPWKSDQAPERASLRARLMFALLGRAIAGPSTLDYLGARAEALVWRCEPQPLADEDLKLAAVNMYASQVEMLGGPNRWGAVLRRYHRFWGGAEPLWYATQTPTRM